MVLRSENEICKRMGVELQEYYDRLKCKEEARDRYYS